MCVHGIIAFLPRILAWSSMCAFIKHPGVHLTIPVRCGQFPSEVWSISSSRKCICQILQISTVAVLVLIAP
jgi:hypothetical protein